MSQKNSVATSILTFVIVIATGATALFGLKLILGLVWEYFWWFIGAVLLALVALGWYGSQESQKNREPHKVP